MDGIELLVGEPLPPSAPYTRWMVQFTQMMTLEYAANLPVGLQQYAIFLGPKLYHQGTFTTKEACFEALRLSEHAPEDEVRMAESAYRKAEESVKRKLAGSSSGENGSSPA